MTTVYPTFLPNQRLPAATVNQITSDINTLQATAGSATDAAASAAAAAASETAAAADRIAAEAAVTAATGPILLTGIGGTATAFTATASHAPATGRSYWLDVPATNTGTCTLAINGGTARSIRQADGTQLVAGMLRSGRRYLLIYSAVNTFLVLSVASVNYFFNAINLVRSAGLNLDFRVADTDAEAWSSLQFISDGRIIFRAGGDGATAGAQVLEIQTDGDVRALVGQFLDSRSHPLYSLYNPPPFQSDVLDHVAMVTGRESLDYTNETRIVSSTETYQLAPPDCRRLMRFTGAGTATAHHLAPGDEVDVDVGASAVLLHSGYVGATAGSAPMAFRGFGGATKVTLPANWSGKIRRRQSDITIMSDDGAPSVVASAAALPAYTRGIAYLGQSWADQETDGGQPGLWAEFNRLGIGAATLSVRFSAKGASGLWKAGVAATSDPTNYWWNEDTVNPGPNALAFVDAVNVALAAEGAPAIGDFYVVVIYGLPDLTMLATGGYYTPDQWTADHILLQQWIRTELGAANLKFIICPVPPQPSGAFNALAYGPLRKAQLEVVNDDADSHRGPSMVGLLRPPGNRHHYTRGREEHGKLIARCIANIEGGSEIEGPKVIGFARIATNQFRFTIDRMGATAMNRPAVPTGIGIALSTAALATRLTILDRKYVWDTDGSGDDILDVYTSDDDGVSTPVPYWPDGLGEGYQQRSATVYAYDAAGDPVWLQDYHPSV